jgi:hypothetical protein
LPFSADASPVFAAGDLAAGDGEALAAGAGEGVDPGVCCARAFPCSIKPAANIVIAVMYCFFMDTFSHCSAISANRTFPHKNQKVNGPSASVF